jgi:hypothetical protein
LQLLFRLIEGARAPFVQMEESMNWDDIAAKWMQFKGSAKQEWASSPTTIWIILPVRVTGSSVDCGKNMG